MLQHDMSGLMLYILSEREEMMDDINQDIRYLSECERAAYEKRKVLINKYCNLHAKSKMGVVQFHRSLKHLNSFWTVLISFLFHSPLHVEFSVTHTWEDRENDWSGDPEKSTDMLRLLPGSMARSTGCSFSGKSVLTAVES